ncbi:hypothetical protein KIPB_003393 [Kipferlia bialata]|uniref:Uncharacterized protein n=1 Tax=Kipferlia bialata TaxID=797122 RepID=A0A9K3GHE5_9EUKA|nr:hypothetical protein KIPB_003393 [Kipferlia bialata]|eukprot:g3393.t1
MDVNGPVRSAAIDCVCALCADKSLGTYAPALIKDCAGRLQDVDAGIKKHAIAEISTLYSTDPSNLEWLVPHIAAPLCASDFRTGASTATLFTHGLPSLVTGTDPDQAAQDILAFAGSMDVKQITVLFQTLTELKRRGVIALAILLKAHNDDVAPGGLDKIGKINISARDKGRDRTKRAMSNVLGSALGIHAADLLDCKNKQLWKALTRLSELNDNPDEATQSEFASLSKRLRTLFTPLAAKDATLGELVDPLLVLCGPCLVTVDTLEAIGQTVTDPQTSGAEAAVGLYLLGAMAPAIQSEAGIRTSIDAAVHVCLESVSQAGVTIREREAALRLVLCLAATDRDVLERVPSGALEPMLTGKGEKAGTTGGHRLCKLAVRIITQKHMADSHVDTEGRRLLGLIPAIGPMPTGRSGIDTVIANPSSSTIRSLGGLCEVIELCPEVLSAEYTDSVIKYAGAVVRRFSPSDRRGKGVPYPLPAASVQAQHWLSYSPFCTHVKLCMRVFCHYVSVTPNTERAVKMVATMFYRVVVALTKDAREVSKESLCLTHVRFRAVISLLKISNSGLRKVPPEYMALVARALLDDPEPRLRATLFARMAMLAKGGKLGHKWLGLLCLGCVDENKANRQTAMNLIPQVLGSWKRAFERCRVGLKEAEMARAKDIASMMSDGDSMLRGNSTPTPSTPKPAGPRKDTQEAIDLANSLAHKPHYGAYGLVHALALQRDWFIPVDAGKVGLGGEKVPRGKTLSADLMSVADRAMEVFCTMFVTQETDMWFTMCIAKKFRMMSLVRSEPEHVKGLVNPNETQEQMIKREADEEDSRPLLALSAMLQARCNQRGRQMGWSLDKKVEQVPFPTSLFRSIQNQIELRQRVKLIKSKTFSSSIRAVQQRQRRTPHSRAMAQSTPSARRATPRSAKRPRKDAEGDAAPPSARRRPKATPTKAAKTKKTPVKRTPRTGVAPIAASTPATARDRPVRASARLANKRIKKSVIESSEEEEEESSQSL